MSVLYLTFTVLCSAVPIQPIPSLSLASPPFPPFQLFPVSTQLYSPSPITTRPYSDFFPLQPPKQPRPRSFFVIEQVVIFDPLHHETTIIRKRHSCSLFFSTRFPSFRACRLLFARRFLRLPAPCFRLQFVLRVRLFPPPVATNSWPHTAHLRTT